MLKLRAERTNRLVIVLGVIGAIASTLAGAVAFKLSMAGGIGSLFAGLLFLYEYFLRHGQWHLAESSICDIRE
jgi:hypothetical protein